MRKFVFLSWAFGIALVGILASCHVMKSDGMHPGDGILPFHDVLRVELPQGASQECCLRAVHDAAASLTTPVAARASTGYLITALAVVAAWRLQDNARDLSRHLTRRRRRGRLFVPYLQYAFARGIIQPKIFEASV